MEILYNNIAIRYGNKEDALNAMRSSATDLVAKNMQLWPLDRLNGDIFKGLLSDEIITAYLNNTLAAGMLLQREDKEFWSNVGSNTLRFIHKLAVMKDFKGKGIGKYMIEIAKQICVTESVEYLRLDCAGDRVKLCEFYEDAGFMKVETKIVGKYLTAFYEMRLTNR